MEQQGNDKPAAIIATTGKVSTLVDGTLRIICEIDPKNAKDAFTLFGSPGTPIALARITQDVAKGEMQKETIKEGGKGPFGDSYTLLFRAGFFFAPKLHEVLGISVQISAMRLQQKTAHEISDKVKSAICEHFDVMSLSFIDPADFRFWLRSLEIEHLLPRDFT